jgi:formyltetrahydrofolate-dependent phosphoribosylglycinamide formyltransferase
VVSNVPGAGGLERARAAGVETLTLDHKPYAKDREAFERDLDALLVQRNVEIVALAGFMRVLTPFFVRAWAGRLTNIHPSLLPKYPGINTHARALEAGDAEHGATVHLVVEEVDAGEILGQASMPILPGDTPETLAERVLSLEHALYPECVAKLARQL